MAFALEHPMRQAEAAIVVPLPAMAVPLPAMAVIKDRYRARRHRRNAGGD